MMHKLIERTLWYLSQAGRVELPQGDLLKRTEPLVIIGEAGMGKSRLLKWLAASPGYTLCTARQLINRDDPRTLLSDAQSLVIDALEEVSTHSEGDAVDRVLRQLGQLGYPRFVLACREADWRSATGLEAIREQYPEDPLELHLKPFDNDDTVTFLSASLGAESAKTVFEHFNTRGLNGLLGNPQTLDFIIRVAEKNSLPETRRELFEQAVEILRVEHRETKNYDQPAREIGLDAAGAAFAGMILTGSDAIVRTPAYEAEGELPLADVSGLPGGEAVEAMLGTRLFTANGADRFSYLHRRVGEYLGARWLAKQADNQRKRRRLLSLFNSHRLVPASLRGLHAWLAQDPALTQDVIAADPMGVIEYGDADELTVEQARSLISALEMLATNDPQFYKWGHYSLCGIAQPELIEELRRLITTPETPFRLCNLVIQAIKGTNIAPDLADDLRQILLDPQAIYANRSSADKALVAVLNKEDSTTILRELHKYGDEHSVRLAINMVDDVGFEHVDDDLIVDLVVSLAKCDGHMLGVLMDLERHLPEPRIEGFLDRLVVEVKTLGEPYKRSRDAIFTDFTYHLIVRSVAAGGVTAEKLWSWLEPFHANVGYEHDTYQLFEDHIQSDDRLRRAVQHHVLMELAGDDNLRQRLNRLRERSAGFEPTTADVVALLEELDPDDHCDERWRDVVRLIQHNHERGTEVRAAARPFAAHRHDLLEWLDKLAQPQVPNWQIKQDERKRKRQEEQEEKNAELRKQYTAHIDQMRKGDFNTIIVPAKAYLNRFTDIGEDVPAHKRVSQWLGDKVSDAAHEGFEAFLWLDQPKPSAKDIGKAVAQYVGYEAGYVIVSALAERHRKGIGFDDLTDEQLMAGLFHLRHTHLDVHAGIGGLRQTIEAVVQTRGLWREAMQLYLEPQLEARREFVDGLDMLIQDEALAELAAEWLKRYPDLPVDPEAGLIDKLLRAGHFDELRNIATMRVHINDDVRRRNWDTVGLIVDFQQTSARLEASPIEPELLWRIRNRIGGNTYIDLSPVQLEWIIMTFRSLWPVVEHPFRVTTGNSNPWDASEYIFHLVRRLGNDTCEDAVAALKRLRDAPEDGYFEMIKVVIAEQTRICAEAAYAPPSLGAINAIARNIAPESAADLQVLVIDELTSAQAKIKSDDIDSWRGFFDTNGIPFIEEKCRDHLIGLLRQGSNEITFDPEAHVAADKRVDIACSVGALRLPIEVKGQWHQKLWIGADKQLDMQYTGDWRAEGRGIYLVLWFGEQQQKNKGLQSPGRYLKQPKTAKELRKMLIADSKSVQDGRVAVFVLDLER